LSSRRALDPGRRRRDDRKSGFGAIQAGNADEAIAILEARSDIHDVFTNVQMPGSMDGLGRVAAEPMPISGKAMR
jgi:hypothetical protein